jgi:hypothetical protein
MRNTVQFGSAGPQLDRSVILRVCMRVGAVYLNICVAVSRCYQLLLSNTSNLRVILADITNKCPTVAHSDSLAASEFPLLPSSISSWGQPFLWTILQIVVEYSTNFKRYDVTYLLQYWRMALTSRWWKTAFWRKIVVTRSFSVGFDRGLVRSNQREVRRT